MNITNKEREARKFTFFMVEKAEGFVMSGDNIQYTTTGWLEDPVCWQILNETVYYPLLLQRAIEGVNRDFHLGICKYKINQDSMAIRIKCGGVIVNQDHLGDNVEYAKESALKYIHEQEKKTT